MKIALLADIHEHLEHLTSAVGRLERECVDRVVVLGDILQRGKRIDQVVKMLDALGASGVFGNHELALCGEPDPELASRFDTTTLEFFADLKPRLEIDDALFTHGMPNWDAHDPTIYYTGEGPTHDQAVKEVFSSHTHQLFVTGHFHRWFAANENGPIEWDGSTPLELADRHLIVVDALHKGSYAVLDTSRRVLVPYRVC